MRHDERLTPQAVFIPKSHNVPRALDANCLLLVTRTIVCLPSSEVYYRNLSYSNIGGLFCK